MGITNVQCYIFYKNNQECYLKIMLENNIFDINKLYVIVLTKNFDSYEKKCQG